MSLWDQVKLNMTEWYAVAADKTEEMARIGVRKYDKFTISRDVERAFTDLGSHVYGAVREGRSDFAGDPVVLGAVERLRTLELELEHKEREIQSIRSQARPWPTPTPASPPPVPAGGRGGPSHDAAPTAADPAPARPTAPGEPDEADIEASLDPRATVPGAHGLEPWDEEIALWNEPLDLDEEAPAEEGRPRPGRGGTD